MFLYIHLDIFTFLLELTSDEPQSRLVAPQGIQKGTIQVRHVDLELPVNFDDNSDSTSDEGSSEDDD